VPCEGFTLIFQAAQRGDRLAENTIYRAAFGKLRTIAAALLNGEAPGHTLQPTALVGELFLKFRKLDCEVLGRDHFFRLSGRAMKQVLVDHARRKKARKRVAPEQVPELLSARGSDPELLLAARQVFEKLRRIDPVAAQSVWMRRVEGRTLEEVAKLQQRRIWRVRADYDFGIDWMARQLSS